MVFVHATLASLAHLATYGTGTTESNPSPLDTLLILVGLVFYVVCFWRIFVKAGRPGWAVIIPIYNHILLLRMAGRSGWWIILLLIPLINLVIYIAIAIGLGKAFGHGWGYILGLILLAPIFIPILAFDRSTYRPPT